MTRDAEEPYVREPGCPGPREARALFTAVWNHTVGDDAAWHQSRRFDALLTRVLADWSGFAGSYGRYRRFASAPHMPPGDRRSSDLWTLYALSRVHDTMILGLQDAADLGRVDPRWPGERGVSGSREQLLRLFKVFGMAPLQVHPFYHEVASAEPDPALGAAVVVEQEVWPGLWFGDLMFARAGVRVRCGPRSGIDPVMAARSCLHFAWTRVHRRTRDLSHGWGSGSQWATTLRRDYADGAMLHYNVDGHIRLTNDPGIPPPAGPDRAERTDAITPQERIELLTHRCLVGPRTDIGDYWPFDDTYTEHAPGPDAIW